MKFALTTWKGKISPVLDTASRVVVIKTDNNSGVNRSELDIYDFRLIRKCEKIISLKVDVLICGAVSNWLSSMLSSSGIDIICGITGNTEEIADAYLNGTLMEAEFFMPGYNKKYRP